MDHEFGEANAQLANAEQADLPGGLYDDAVVTEDATGLDDDVAVAGLDIDIAVAEIALDPGAELDIDGSLLDAIETELADVERALALLDEGTYGQCEHCNGAIDDDVLAGSPTARYCAEHLPLSLR